MVNENKKEVAPVVEDSSKKGLDQVSTPEPPKEKKEAVERKAGDKLGVMSDAKGQSLMLESKEVTPMDLSKLGVNSLIKLEDKYPGVLLYVFSDIIGSKEKIDFSKWEFYKKPIAGQEIKVDFKGNDAANREIGAADFLPPSVRCITVYEQGDKVLARTSKRRLGLKGRNRSSGNIGFFDKEGYMPVFTGDVIIAGGAVPDAAKNINLDYEKPFLIKKGEGDKEELVLDEESYTKYEQSDEAKKDKEFMDQLLKDNPYAARRKGVTAEDIAAMEARNTASGIGSNIVKTILMVARNGGMGLKGKHCWDWSNKIYRMAGVTGKWPAKSLFSYTKNYPGKDCKAGGGPGKSYATEAQYDLIKPGDWVFYNNRNTADTHGNHSALFIEWIDKDRKLARMASGSSGVPWHIHSRPVDFNDKPMTHLGKPNRAKPELPNVASIEEKYRQDRLPPTLA